MNTSDKSFHFGHLVRTVIVVLPVAFLVIVVFQNWEIVETRILFSRFEMPRATLLFLTFAIGVFTGVLTHMALRSRWGRSDDDDRTPWKGA